MKHIIFALGFLACMCVNAHAASKDYELLFPAIAPEGGVQAESARIMRRFVAAGAYLQGYQNPIVLRNQITGAKYENPVPYRVQLRLVGAVAIKEWLQAGIDLPVSLAQGFRTVGTQKTDTQFAFNDLIVRGKFPVWQSKYIAVAASVAFRVNTGSNGGVSGLEGRWFEPFLGLVSEYNIDSWYLRANIGWQERQRTLFAELANYIRDDQILYQVAGGYWLQRDINTIFLEYSGVMNILTGASGPEQRSHEVYAGYQHRKGPWIFGPAGSIGLGTGFGVPAYRLMWMTWFGMPAANEPWIRDRDSDGLADTIDQCPTEPEDMDLFEDADGCPEPDNDNDGVADATDGCPLEPEDLDGFEDEDGCPDSDDDGDGIVDALDQCVREPETVNNYRDTDGCPDDPRSRVDIRLFVQGTSTPVTGTIEMTIGGVTQAVTAPAYTMEVSLPTSVLLVVSADEYLTRRMNLRVPAGVFVTEVVELEKPLVEIEVTAKELKVPPVQFASGTADIAGNSFEILDTIVQFLQGSPDVSLRIEGHTDSQGGAGANRRLSQRRADAVMAFLVEGGIAPERLIAEGFGEDQPVADNATAAGRARNRRVEYHIQDELSEPKPAAQDEPMAEDTESHANSPVTDVRQDPDLLAPASTEISSPGTDAMAAETSAPAPASAAAE